MSFATLEGFRVTAAEVHLPQYGAWWATVELDDESTLSGSVTLKIGALDLVGTIDRGRSFAGTSKYRIVAGANGWRTTVAAKGYASGALQMSTVLADAARDSGETLVSGYTDRSLGTSFAREAAPASNVLDELVGSDGWYMRADGATVLDARTDGAVDQPYRVLNYNPPARVAIVDTDNPEAFEPGKTIAIETAELVISALSLRVTRKGLRLHVELAESATEGRLERAVRAAVAKLLPRQLAYLGVHEYRIVAQSAQLLDVTPRYRDRGLPELAGVPQYPGLHGTETDATVGATVLVSFLNGDPTRPIVCGYERPEATGATATQIRLGGGVLRVARESDTVTGGYLRFNPAIPLLEYSTDAAVWVPVTVVSPATITGQITSGRDEVRA